MGAASVPAGVRGQAQGSAARSLGWSRNNCHPEFLAKLKDPAAAEAAAKAELLPSGPRGRAARSTSNPHDGEIHVLPVQGNVYMLVGDGGNIAVQVGDEGPLVVDTGAGELSDKVIAAIRKLSDQADSVHRQYQLPLRSYRRQREAARVGTGSQPLGSFFSGQFADAGKGATIIAHQNVQNRLSAPGGKVSADAGGWLAHRYFPEGRRRKYHNDEAVEIFWEPNAITDGDSIVQFRRSDVIVTGDIFNTTQLSVHRHEERRQPCKARLRR